MLAGLIYFAFIGGWNGVLFSLAGLLAGSALLLIPFILGGMGGGDVKLLGAIGALQGASFVLAAFLVGAILGGMLSIIYLAVKGRLGLILRRLGGVVVIPLLTATGFSLKAEIVMKIEQWFSPAGAREEEKLYLPYGVPLATGVLLTLSGLAQRYLPGLFLWQ